MLTSGQRPLLVHRPDIDGLRALAILPVVLYHCGLPGLRGGFVGVDIFFVISGFLITSILLRDIEAGRFSIVEFYERRARRILPALFVVLGVTAALALFVFLPVDLRELGKSLASTTLSGSNLFFWRQAGYFDRSAELKPLLHTWSLSVEEQFYIAFPILLWISVRLLGSRLVARVIGICLCASLALSVIAAARWPVAAFYLPLTRAWELLTGAFLATGAVANIRSARLRDAFSLVGIAVIAGSVTLIDRSMAFPGWIAAIPCLGAALLIQVSLSGGGIGNRALQSRVLVGIGLVSYSLYLWHWPLLVLAKYAVNRDLRWLELTAVMLVASGAAVLSWRYVERPFRGARSPFGRGQVFRFAFAGSGAVFALGAAFVVSGGFPSRLPGNVLQYARVASEDFEVKPPCFNPTADDVRNDRLCAIGAGAAAAPSFVVWGDSHASRVSVPLADIAAARDRRGLLASVGWCPPLVDVQWPLAGCEAFNQEVLKLVETKKLDTVVLAGKWADYAEGVSFTHALGDRNENILSDSSSEPRSVSNNPAVFARALRRTVERLTQAGAHVVVIGPIPEIQSAVPETLAKAEWFGGPQDIGPSGLQFQSRQKNVLTSLAALQDIPGARVIYPNAALCSATCAVERRGEVLYVDDNHLSRAGLKLLQPLLESVFVPVFRSARLSAPAL